MLGLVESATAILSASERRLETISNNVANVSTPGYKRQIAFTDMMTPPTDTAISQVRSDFTEGKLNGSANPLDLAITGAGFFQLRDGERTIYSRAGRFALADDGRVVTGQGYVLQQAGGGDLVLENAAVEIAGDGTVSDRGRAVARIGLVGPGEGAEVRALGGSLFEISGEAVDRGQGATLRQNMVEASNVVLGDEMVAMMTAVRQSESGARIVQVYDDLIARAITTFSQSGR